MPESQNIEYTKSMTKQTLLEQLQDIEWDNFEVKTARTDVPKDVWETVSAFSRLPILNLCISTHNRLNQDLQDFWINRKNTIKI
jgi:hypothetical protein